MQTACLKPKRKAKESIAQNFRKYPWLYIMSIPVTIFYFVYWYLPMYGIVIAFQNYVPTKGVLGSQWVGFEHFITFFNNRNFGRLISNTLSINIQLLIFGFPIPILFAILLNELPSLKFRKMTQTITYMPHFVSSVVICGLLTEFCRKNGLITNLLGGFGVANENLLSHAEMFQPLYVAMHVWQGFGWDSIIYFAALMAIDQQLYEAAKVDGAARIKQIWHITLPGIAPTIIMLMILRIGGMMSLGWDRIVLLYNPMTYAKADVISSYVYRTGLTQLQYSYATAVGLFNSVINVILLVLANTISRRVNDSALW